MPISRKLILLFLLSILYGQTYTIVLDNSDRLHIESSNIISNTFSDILLKSDEIGDYFVLTNIISDSSSNYNINQKILHVDEVQKVTSKKFKLTKTFVDFETIKKGFIIAKDETKCYIADKKRIILFGTPNKPIGAEAYILGTWIK